MVKKTNIKPGLNMGLVVNSLFLWQSWEAKFAKQIPIQMGENEETD